MAYLLDTSIFIEAKNRYYNPEICPGFWDWMIRANAAGKVFSIGHVQDELTHESEDWLAQWAAGLPEEFFLAVTESDLPALGEIAAWADAHQRYSDAAKATFLDSADYYLVAQARSGGHTVVTLEVPRPSVNNVKIPNACVEHHVKFLNTWQMLQRERAQFVLAER